MSADDEPFRRRIRELEAEVNRCNGTGAVVTTERLTTTEVARTLLEQRGLVTAGGESVSLTRNELAANISRCWQHNGWHAYMAGPCFDTREAAVDYRDRLDAAGVTWWPQDRLSSLPPVPEEQP